MRRSLFQMSAALGALTGALIGSVMGGPPVILLMILVNAVLFVALGEGQLALIRLLLGSSDEDGKVEPEPASTPLVVHYSGRRGTGIAVAGVLLLAVSSQLPLVFTALCSAAWGVIALALVAWRAAFRLELRDEGLWVEQLGREGALLRWDEITACEVWQGTLWPQTGRTGDVHLVLCSTGRRRQVVIPPNVEGAAQLRLALRARLPAERYLDPFVEPIQVALPGRPAVGGPTG